MFMIVVLMPIESSLDKEKTSTNNDIQNVLKNVYVFLLRLLPFLEILWSFVHFFSLPVFQFSEIIFIDHQTGNKAYFKRKSNLPMMAALNYGKTASAFGLWEGVETNKAYSYQLLICNHSFYSGFFVSGYTNNCYKKCDSWCHDTKSPYFRTAPAPSSQKGVAFNTNGHHPNVPNNRLMSVGLR